MRSFALSESVLSSHFLPRPPRSLPSQHPFSLAPSDEQISRLSFRHSSSISSWRRQWFDSTVEDRFSRFIPSASRLGDGPETHHIDCLREDECGVTYELPEKTLERKWFAAIENLTSSNPSFCGLLKFSTLVGFLALQGSGPAIASSDIASGLQSLPFLGDLGDISTGFTSAFLLIFFSELGDKTFFIAALLAARNSAAVVFAGTFGALAAMTVVSVVLGRTFHYVDELLPFRFGETDLPVDDIAAVCLLVYFGISTLLDATSNDSPKSEDEQKEAELAVSKFSGNGAGILAAANTVISTFVLVFVAEWGDKSFFSTIALAAASSPLGVIGGALAGHGLATLVSLLLTRPGFPQNLFPTCCAGGFFARNALV
ncbi:GDT1-like protein 1, chloroplastic isoform X2 [Punica granatum]|uniref:GDT1 family protein n=1 Tax=Punica granatum TaxID=22663 RepID=A0A6P8ED86_PUNGR|nr:GDT1-like protein 1, chloroplastic isoform X2 [Punica granatum]